LQTADDPVARDAIALRIPPTELIFSIHPNEETIKRQEEIDHDNTAPVCLRSCRKRCDVCSHFERAGGDL
jgi:hypothetical protein